jgi:hypothetical protein
MRIQSIGALLVGLILAACSTGTTGPAPSDTGPPPPPLEGGTPPPDESVAPPPIDNPDAGCDEDAMGEHYCIINSPGGNGTRVARQNPVPYQSCM